MHSGKSKINGLTLVSKQGCSMNAQCNDRCQGCALMTSQYTMLLLVPKSEPFLLPMRTISATQCSQTNRTMCNYNPAFPFTGKSRRALSQKMPRVQGSTCIVQLDRKPTAAHPLTSFRCKFRSDSCFQNLERFHTM